MQQIYDMWLTLTAQNLQADGAVLSQSSSEEKNIVMPTDYAEPLVGLLQETLQSAVCLWDVVLISELLFVHWCICLHVCVF